MDKGSLVMVDPNGKVKGNGVFNIHKTTPTYADYDYTYWSSPTEQELISGALANSPANYIYSFNTANFLDLFDGNYPQTTGSPDTFDDNGDDWQSVAQTDTMTPGVGYIAMGEGSPLPFVPNSTGTQNQSVVFTGKVNTGIIRVNVFKDKYHTDGLTGADVTNTNSNLIGNPYPSAIDLTALYTINNETTPLLEGTFYYWTHDSSITTTNPGPDAYNFTSNDYATATYDGITFINTTGASNGTTAPQYLASGQSIMVNVLDNGILKFTNAMRVTGNNDVFLRPPAPIDLLKLNLTNAAGTHRQIAIAFKPTGNDDFTAGQDGQRLENGNKVDFYSTISTDERRFAIQTLGTFNDSKTVNLGLEIISDGMYEIALDQMQGVFENGQEVFLHDHLTQTIHLFTNGAYSFNSVIGDNIEDRFTLLFRANPLGVNEITNHSNITVIDAINQFRINANTNISQIHIYNVLGQTLVAKNTNATVITIPAQIKKGQILFVEVSLENGNHWVQKIIKK